MKIDIETTVEQDQLTQPQTEGEPEVVLPAPAAITLFAVDTAENPDETYRLMVVGWNQAGSPVVVDADGGLRMLHDTEQVAEVTWGDGH